MPYRVPDDATLLKAALSVLASAQSIVSQRRLRNEVIRALGTSNPPYAVAGERVRRLVATHPKVRLELRARKGPREKILNRCPVCRSAFKRQKNQTLFGGEVTLTLRCSACGYWTGKQKRIPTLYVFHHRGPPGPRDSKAPASDGLHKSF